MQDPDVWEAKLGVDEVADILGNDGAAEFSKAPVPIGSLVNSVFRVPSTLRLL